jgi:hypothetical protein
MLTYSVSSKSVLRDSGEYGQEVERKISGLVARVTYSG